MPAEVDLSTEIPSAEEGPTTAPAGNPPRLPPPVQRPAGPPVAGAEDLSNEQPSPVGTPSSAPYNPERERENIRGELARRLVWLLVFAVGGVLLFVGMGLLDGSVMVQS